MLQTSELDADLLRQLGWTNFWDRIEQRVQEEVNRGRKVSPLLPRWVDEGVDPDALLDCTLETSVSSLDPLSPRPLRIPVRPRLVAVEIASEFQISPNQFGDATAALHLVTKAAHRVALAEDAILLYGQTLVPGAVLPLAWPQVAQTSRFHDLQVSIQNLQNLDAQSDYLFRWKEFPRRAGMGQGAAHPRDPSHESVAPWQEQWTVRADPDQILKSIHQGIDELRNDGHFGDYCVIVDRSLYEAALTQRLKMRSRMPALFDAPIQQIRALLREGGFGFSWMALPNTGAIFSVGGGAAGLAVPREAHVAFVRADREMTLSVQERIRLLVNEETAVRPLRNAP